MPIDKIALLQEVGPLVPDLVRVPKPYLVLLEPLAILGALLLREKLQSPGHLAHRDAVAEHLPAALFGFAWRLAFGEGGQGDACEGIWEGAELVQWALLAAEDALDAHRSRAVPILPQGLPLPTAIIDAVLVSLRLAKHDRFQFAF